MQDTAAFVRCVGIAVQLAALCAALHRAQLINQKHTQESRAQKQEGTNSVIAMAVHFQALHIAAGTEAEPSDQEALVGAGSVAICRGYLAVALSS